MRSRAPVARRIVDAMTTFLSHTTALEAMRRWDLRSRLATGERCAAIVPPNLGDLESLLGPGSLLGSLEKPLHLLVSAPRSLARTELAHAHLQGGPLPDGSAVQIADGVLCSSPELLAVQMAPLLTRIELIYLLSELLGFYAICPASKDGMFRRREPLSTPERMLDFLGRMGSRPGVQMVRRALGEACVGSGSPRETKLSMRLGLKPALGGHHLNVLSMNEPLEVRRIRDRMQAGVRKPDILLASPDGRRIAAMEYLGRVHDAPSQLAQDANRTNELKAIGVSEYVVRREQYGDLDYMDGLVAEIRRELGLPRIGMTRATAEARKERRRALCEELERIDGVSWTGRARERAAREAEKGGAEKNALLAAETIVVPLDAYGLV